jgi:hypothetical protein
MPGFFTIFTAMTEDEHRENDVDDDIGQWIVLLF